MLGIELYVLVNILWRYLVAAISQSHGLLDLTNLRYVPKVTTAPNLAAICYTAWLKWSRPDCLLTTKKKLLFGKDEALAVFMNYWMNSCNIYVLYCTLGSIHVVLHKYSFFIVDHLPANVRIGMTATEVIQVDLNYGDAASPCGEPGK